ncbi:FixG Ig-like domain-containing protein, partial [Pseudomonas aeruginosa]|uniref:FixG Ig-like domain-containing protein n=1 Tax=Pseudomonas aeruginosa TaxID=287 RepID=UPI003969B3BE
AVARGVGVVDGAEGVAAGDILNLPMELSIEPEKLPSTTNEIVFTIESADDPSIHKEAKSRFIGPRTR